jgi:hypothetical protein
MPAWRDSGRKFSQSRMVCSTSGSRAFRSGDMAISGQSRVLKHHGGEACAVSRLSWGRAWRSAGESGPNPVSVGVRALSRMTDDHLTCSDPAPGSFSGLRAMRTLQGEAPGGDTGDRLLRRFVGVPTTSRPPCSIRSITASESARRKFAISGSVTMACVCGAHALRIRVRR